MTDTEQKALAVTTAELIEKLERVEPCTVCGIVNPNHWIHLAPFHDNCHDYAPAAIKAKEADNGNV